MVARTIEQRQDLLKKAQERLASLKSNSAKATNRQLETAIKSVEYAKRISAPKPRARTNVPKDKIFCRTFPNGKVWCKDRANAGNQPLRSGAPKAKPRVSVNHAKAFVAVLEEQKKIVVPAKSNSKEDFNARIEAFNKFNKAKRDPASKKAIEYMATLTGDDKERADIDIRIAIKQLKDAQARFRSAYQKDFGVKLKRQSRRK